MTGRHFESLWETGRDFGDWMIHWETAKNWMGLGAILMKWNKLIQTEHFGTKLNGKGQSEKHKKSLPQYGTDSMVYGCNNLMQNVYLEILHLMYRHVGWYFFNCFVLFYLAFGI